MSTSGAVYQPTTVTYESEHPPQQPWSHRPISYIAATVSQAARRPCGMSCVPLRNVLPVVYLTSAIASFAIGLTLIIHGAIGYLDDPPETNASFYLSVIIIGALLFVVAFLFIILLFKITRRWCFRSGKDHLDSSVAQDLTVNPSTDLLVAAQYAPVSEVTYQPPNEESEQSKLMPQENKDIITNEETDRMLETDPRIVLRPLHQNIHEET